MKVTVLDVDAVLLAELRRLYGETVKDPKADELLQKVGTLTRAGYSNGIVLAALSNALVQHVMMLEEGDDTPPEERGQMLTGVMILCRDLEKAMRERTRPPESVGAREFPHVVDRVMAEVPPGWAELRGALIKLKQDSFYAAPEDQRRFWAGLADLLGRHLPWPAKEAWQDQVGRIVRGEA